MAKTDIGVQAADKEFLLIEKRLKRLYTQAEKDIKAKMDAFYARFQRKQAKWMQDLKDGTVTMAEYQSWLRGQVFQGAQWQAKRKSIANTLLNINAAAISLVNDAMPNVFQVNGNYAAYQIENSAGVEFGFNLYNPTTIKELIVEDANILPFKKLNKSQDLMWNFQLIKNEVAKGIIEGEGIDKIAKRLATAIPNRNMSMLRTHARTMVTSAQNKGRLTRFEEAENKGIRIEKEWMATLDGRTRDTHRLLDGQRQPLDLPFKVEGLEIMYPCDPYAHPSLVYNCRCTMNSVLKDYPPQYKTRTARGDDGKSVLISHMSYQDWLKWKEGR